MCTVLLPPGNNPIAVNKYISYIYIQRERERGFKLHWCTCRSCRWITVKSECSESQCHHHVRPSNTVSPVKFASIRVHQPLPVVTCTCLLLQRLVPRVWSGCFELHSDSSRLFAPHVSAASLFTLVHDFSKMFACLWQEMTDTLLAYGGADRNGKTAQRLYRRLPHHSMFATLNQQLRETGGERNTSILPLCLITCLRGTSWCSHCHNSYSMCSSKLACRMWFMRDGGSMPSQYERTSMPVSFTLDWTWWLFPLSARSADLNLVSLPDYHYNHHHHTVPVLLCKIKISSIYHVRELQPHFIKSRSCNRSRRYLSSHVIYDIYAHFLPRYERVSLSSTHNCRRWPNTWKRQSSRTCNLQETTSTDRSVGIGENPR